MVMRNYQLLDQLQTFMAVYRTYLIVCDLQKVIGVASAEFILYVGGNRKLSYRGDRLSNAEPQTLSPLLHPIQGP